jgi:hypothetical protein
MEDCILIKQCEIASGIKCKDRAFTDCDLFNNLLKSHCEKLDKIIGSKFKCVVCGYNKICSRTEKEAIK